MLSTTTMKTMEFPGLTDAYDADYVGELISDMREHGYEFDELSSYDGYLCFRDEIACGLPTIFSDWSEVGEWLKNISYED